MANRACIWLLSITLACAFIGCTFNVDGDPNLLLNPSKVQAELQPEVYLQKGNELAKIRQFEKAISQFSEVIRLDPENAMGYNNRGHCWIQTKQWEKALADLNEAIRLDKDLELAHRNRLEVSRAMSDSDNIIIDTNEILRLDPNDIAALIYRGMARSEVGQYTTAAEDFRKALTLNKDSGAAHNGLAWLLATVPQSQFRDGAAAIQHAKAAVSSPNGMNYLFLDTLAAAFAECQQLDQAIKCQRKAIELAQNESDRQELRERLEIYKSGRPYRMQSIPD